MTKIPSYPEYKASGVNWIGEIPRAWDVARVRYLASIETGSRDTADAEAQGTFPFFVRSQTVETIGTFSFDCEAVLTAGDGVGVGKVFHHYTGKFEAHQRVYVMRQFKRITGRFFYYYFQNLFSKVALDGGAKSTVDSLRRPMLADFPMCVPPSAEQPLIVEYLDRETAKIDDLIGKQERLIELLGEKRQATISRVITKGLNPAAPRKPSGVPWLGDIPEHWECKQIKWLSQVRRGASPRPIDNPDYFDENGDWSWVRIADVSASDGTLTSTSQQLSELGSSLSVKLEPGSLFVSIAGTVGKPCINQIKACIHDGFVYFPTLKVNPKYLFHIFEAGRCYEGLGKMGTQLNLNTDTIGSIYVPVPPEHEVEEILAALSSQLREIDALSWRITQFRELLIERRSALICAAVTGKIDVRGGVLQP